MLKSAPTPDARPYWHVDLKWVFGIIFAAGLAVTLILHVLTTLTSKSVAIPVATQVAAGMFSRQGLDDSADIEQLKQKARLQPGDKVETLPGIFITKVELETLSPRELRLRIFSRVVTPYYELGAKEVAARQTADPAERADIERQAGLLALLNQATHDTLATSRMISFGALILPLIGLVYFSAGFGRLVSPGLVMVLLTFPAAILGLITQIAQRSSKPFGSDGPGAAAGPGLSPESILTIMNGILPGYLAIFGLGITLLLIAGIGKIVSKRHQS
jgi:hypothetical protein